MPATVDEGDGFASPQLSSTAASSGLTPLLAAGDAGRRKVRTRPRPRKDTKENEKEENEGSRPLLIDTGAVQGAVSSPESSPFRGGRSSGGGPWSPLKASLAGIQQRELHEHVLTVAEHDIVSGPPLSGDEVYRFLIDDFRDGTGATALLPSEAAMMFKNAGGEQKGKRCVIHVESSSTGRFFRIVEDGGKSQGHHHHHHHHHGMFHGKHGWGSGDAAIAEELGITRGALAVLKSDKLLVAVWNFCQGLLAGICVLTLYTSYMANAGNEVAFLDTYRATAGETRRLLFIFSTLGLVGMLDTRVQLSDRWHLLRPWEQFDINLSILLHTICLITTLLCAQVDAEIRGRFGASAEDTGWAYRAVTSEDFQSKMDQWVASSIVRAVSAISAWLLSCARAYNTSLTTLRTEHELQQQTKAADEAHITIGHYKGQGLESLDETSLLEMAAAMRRTADHAEASARLRAR